jgi:hypothetical protein
MDFRDEALSHDTGQYPATLTRRARLCVVRGSLRTGCMLAVPWNQISKKGSESALQGYVPLRERGETVTLTCTHQCHAQQYGSSKEGVQEGYTLSLPLPPSMPMP